MSDAEQINADVRAAWNAIAPWWDVAFGDADVFHAHLIQPFLEEALALKPGAVLLDLACGNGGLARRFARQQIEVVGVDFCEPFLQAAAARSPSGNPRYECVDLTRAEELQGLGLHRFDAAVCSMAMHDMAEIAPMLEGLTSVLRPGGRFALAVPHPVFNSAPRTVYVREDDYTGEEKITTHSVRISSYLKPAMLRCRAKPDQPRAQLMFHRSLESLLQPCFDAGFRMSFFREPSAALLPEDSGSSWQDRTSIPPILVVGFVLAG